MPLLERRKTLAAKIETTYATDPTISTSTDGIQTVGLEIMPLDADYANRELDRAQLGAEPDLILARRMQINTQIESASSGTAGTAPAWGKLLRGCGFAETINAGVSAVYAPVSSSFSSLWMEVNLDGNKHTAKGCRGNVGLSWQARALPRFDFQFTGLYQAFAAAALPTLTMTMWKAPLAINKANTATATLHSTTLQLESFSVDMQNQIEHRDIVNVEEVLLTDRNVRGSMTFEMPAQGTKDWLASIIARTNGALQIVHGTAGGGIVQIDAPAVEISNPRYGESQGVLMLTVDFTCLPSSGNDEITITAK